MASKENGVLPYLKRLSKSIAYTGIDVLKDQMPITGQMINDNKQVVKETFNSVIDFKQHFTRLKNIREQYVFKPLSEGLANLKRDIKTGDFYKESDGLGAMGEELLGSIGDELGFDISALMNGSMAQDLENEEQNIDGEQQQQESSSQLRGDNVITRGDIVNAVAVNTEIRRGSKGITKAIVASSGATIDALKIISNQQYIQNQKQLSLLNNGFSSLSHGMNALIEFNNKVMMQHVQNSNKFYTEMTRLTQEDNAILKEFIDMQRNMYSSYMKKEDNEPSLHDKMFGSGGFKLSAFKDYVMQNIDNNPALMMIKMALPAIRGAIKDISQNPLQFITKQAINSLMGPKLKTAMKDFDSNINGYIQTALGQLFDYGIKNDNNSISGIVANLLGYKEHTRKLNNINLSHFNKGPMPWNGMAQKALIEVIPGHLRRIEAGITKQAERFFNFDTGKWDNARSIDRAGKEFDRQYEEMAMSGFMNDMGISLNTLVSDKNEKKKLRKELNNLKHLIYKHGGIDEYVINRALYLTDNPLYMQIIISFMENMDRTVKTNITANINKAKSTRNKDINSMLDSGGLSYRLINNLNESNIGNLRFNNDDRFLKTGKPITSKDLNNLDPILTPDKSGNNLLDYQMKIYRELYAVKNALLSGYGGRGRKYNKKQKETKLYEGFDKINKQKSTPDKNTEAEIPLIFSDPIINKQYKNRLYRAQNKSMISRGYEKLNTIIDFSNIDQEKYMNDIQYQREINDRINDTVTKMAKERKKIDTERKNKYNKGPLDGIFGFLKPDDDSLPSGVNPGSDFIDQLIQAGSVVDKISVIKNSLSKLGSAPQAIAASAIMVADNAIYNMLFETEVKDKDGNVVKGFMNRMLLKLDETFEAANKKINEILKTGKDKLSKAWSYGKNTIKSILGLDVDAAWDEIKERAKRAGEEYKDSVSGILKDIISGAKKNIKDTYNDAKEAYDKLEKSKDDEEDDDHILTVKERMAILKKKRDATKNIIFKERAKKAKGHAEGVKNVNKGGLAFISEGEAIIPANMNPFNPNRNRVSISHQKANENGMRNRLVQKLGDISRNIPGHAAGAAAVSTDDYETNWLSLARGDDFSANRINLKGKKYQRIEEAGKKQYEESGGDYGHSDIKNILNKKVFMKALQATILPGINEFIGQAFGIDAGKAAKETKNFVSNNFKDLAGGGTVGALLSLVFPMGGPLMGAVAGAAVSLVKNNETIQKYIFGEEVVEDGIKKHKGGLLSDKMIKTFEKYWPDAKKYGTVGGIAGLVLPFGPLGGAMIGASVSLMKNNKTIHDLLFGDKDGLLNKDRKAKLRKAFPRIAASTISILLFGHFGILGNAAIGAGLGMLTTTEAFKRIMLGSKDANGVRHGGLAGAVRRQIVEPFKNSMKEIKTNVAGWFRSKVFSPIAEGLKPIGLLAAYTARDAARKMGRSISNFFTKKVGTFFERMFNKLGIFRWLGRGIRNTVGFLGRNTIGRIANGIKGLGFRAKTSMVEKGYGDKLGMSAEEQLLQLRKAGIGSGDAYNKLKSIMNTSAEDLEYKANVVDKYRQQLLDDKNYDKNTKVEIEHAKSKISEVADTRSQAGNKGKFEYSDLIKWANNNLDNIRQGNLSKEKFIKEMNKKVDKYVSNKYYRKDIKKQLAESAENLGKMQASKKVTMDSKTFDNAKRSMAEMMGFDPDHLTEAQKAQLMNTDELEKFSSNLRSEVETRKKYEESHPEFKLAVEANKNDKVKIEIADKQLDWLKIIASGIATGNADPKKLRELASKMGVSYRDLVSGREDYEKFKEEQERLNNERIAREEQERNNPEEDYAKAQGFDTANFDNMSADALENIKEHDVKLSSLAKDIGTNAAEGITNKTRSLLGKGETTFNRSTAEWMRKIGDTKGHSTLHVEQFDELDADTQTLVALLTMRGYALSVKDYETIKEIVDDNEGYGKDLLYDFIKFGTDISELDKFINVDKYDAKCLMQLALAPSGKDGKSFMAAPRNYSTGELFAIINHPSIKKLLDIQDKSFKDYSNNDVISEEQRKEISAQLSNRKIENNIETKVANISAIIDNANKITNEANIKRREVYGKDAEEKNAKDYGYNATDDMLKGTHDKSGKVQLPDNPVENAEDRESTRLEYNKKKEEEKKKKENRSTTEAVATAAQNAEETSFFSKIKNFGSKLFGNNEDTNKTDSQQAVEDATAKESKVDSSDIKAVEGNNLLSPAEKAKVDNQVKKDRSGVTSEVSDADGSVVQYGKSSSDGQPMKLKNKNNIEIEKKNKFKVALQERSTKALEAIANKIEATGKGAKGAARKAGSSLLDLIKSIFDPFKQLWNLVTAIPIIGPLIAGMVGKVKKGILTLGKTILAAIKGRTLKVFKPMIDTITGFKTSIINKIKGIGTGISKALSSLVKISVGKLGKIGGGIGKILLKALTGHGKGKLLGAALLAAGGYNALTGDDTNANDLDENGNPTTDNPNKEESSGGLLDSVKGIGAYFGGSKLASSLLKKTRFGKFANLGGAIAGNVASYAVDPNQDMSDMAINTGLDLLTSGINPFRKGETVKTHTPESRSIEKAKKAGEIYSDYADDAANEMIDTALSDEKVKPSMNKAQEIGARRKARMAEEVKNKSKRSLFDKLKDNFKQKNKLFKLKLTRAQFNYEQTKVGKLDAKLSNKIYNGAIDLSNKASKLKDTALDTIDKTKNLATKAINNESTQALITKIKEAITGLGPKIKSLAPPSFSKTIIPALEKLGSKIIERLIKSPAAVAKLSAKLAKDAIRVGAAATGVGTILTVGMTLSYAVSSFMHGYSDVDTLLKLPPGSATTPMKVCAGIALALVSAIPFVGAIIPEDMVLEMAIKYIGPIFGFGEKELNDLRNKAKQQGGDTVNPGDSNSQDQKQKSIFGSVVDSLKAGAQSVVGTVLEKAKQFSNFVSNNYQYAKDKTSQLWDSAKNGASTFGSWVSDKASSAINAVKSGASYVGGKIMEGAKAGWEGIKSIGSKIGSGINNFIDGKGKHANYGMGGFYSQLDPAYAMPFNTPEDTESQSMYDSGCGPMAAMNALSSVGINGDPRYAAQYALSRGYKEKDGGTRPQYFNDFFRQNGLDSKTLSSPNDIKKNLQQGNPVVLMGKDINGESSKSPYAENPHYVTATGIDNKGNITIQDPESNQPNKIYKANEVLSRTTNAISARSKRYGRGLINSMNRVFHRSGMGKYSYGRGGDISPDKMWALANWASTKTNVDPKLIYGQWYHESSGFSSQLAVENYNFGGMTQSSPTGDPNDKQPDGDNWYMHFGNPEEWAEYYSWYLNQCNSPSLSGSKDVSDFAQRLKQNGYYGASVEEYINGIQGGINSIPSGQPNMSLIDTSKFGKHSTGTPTNSTSEGNQPKSKSWFGALANVAQIFSDAMNPFSNSGSNNNSASQVDGNGVKAKIWNFLAGKGLSPIVISGIMGNIQQECSFNPSATNGKAFGIMQWTEDRKSALDKVAQKNGKDWTDLDSQLEYMWNEIGPGGQYNKYLEACKSMGSPSEVAGYWDDNVEVSGGGERSKRQQYAEEIYKEFTSGNNNSQQPSKTGKGKHSSFYGRSKHLISKYGRYNKGANRFHFSKPAGVVKDELKKKQEVEEAKQHNLSNNQPSSKSSSSSGGGTDYTGGFFDKISGLATKMASPLKNAMSRFGKNVLGAVGGVFGNSIKKIFGDDNPFASIFGQSNDNKGNSSNSGGVQASSAQIQAGIDYIKQAVAQGKEYGDNGCTACVNDFLAHAGYGSQAINPYVLKAVEESKNSGKPARWKQPSEGGVIGDIVVLDYDKDPNDGDHVGIFDGDHGMWHNSSNAGHKVVWQDLNEWGGQYIIGYIATGGGGQGSTVKEGGTTSVETMRSDSGSTNSGSGKYGRGKYGRNKFLNALKSAGKFIGRGLRSFSNSLTSDSAKEAYEKYKASRTNEVGPNGLPYSQNDIDYLTNNGLSREDAIKTLSQDPKYTTNKDTAIVSDITPSQSATSNSISQSNYSYNNDLSDKLDKLIKLQTQNNQMMSALVRFATAYVKISNTVSNQSTKQMTNTNTDQAYMPNSASMQSNINQYLRGTSATSNGTIQSVGSNDLNEFNTIIASMEAIATR